MAKSENKSAAASPLTEREMEILRLIARGFTGPQIAKKLFISALTVDTHRTHIRNKTDCHNAAALTRFALANGFWDKKGNKTTFDL